MKMPPRTINNMAVRYVLACEWRRCRGGIEPTSDRRRPCFRAPAYRWFRQRFRSVFPKPGAFDRRFKPMPF